MTTSNQIDQTELDQLIADEFGVNSTYVSDLLQQYRQSPQLVDEAWRAYFHELLGNGDAPAQAASATPASAVPQAGEATAPRAVAAAPAPVTQAAPAQAAPAQTAPAQAAPAQAAADEPQKSERLALRGPAQRIAENMKVSLGVPTATSQREIPLKLLDENRRLINQHLKASGRKVSYTHLIARAILKAIKIFPSLNDSYEEADGTPYRVHHEGVNLGVAVDVTKKDGSRTLLVPNVKASDTLTFSELLGAYDDIVRRARDGKLQVADFQGTTISLTNPGTLGTTASNPRLMAGQGVIVATGAIDHPPEYQAMSPEALSRLGISKVMTITSTYDHRIIQGAESGAFLARIDELLRGKHDFYDEIFLDLGIPYRPYRWAIDLNPAILGEERHRDEIRKQARVFELINAYRVRGHLVADVDPLGWKEVQYHPELDIETYGLTIWDLDREFIASGLGGNETATLREIVDLLRRFYCGKVSVEYRNIQGPEEKEWIRARVEGEHPPAPSEARKQMLWKLISAELFEKFLGTKYLGQKRFSIEGNETVVAMLDQLIESAAGRAINDITIGMSHRGRLNVIANVIGKFCERIFTSFEGSIHPSFPHDQGDVKYHQGASGIRETSGGELVALSVASNPSHLEFVDPVVEGIVRAKQDQDGRGREYKLAVLLHGDAAFAGEGVVAETLNLSQLLGYRTGGTIHFIVNNQLGFTTPPEEGRSSTYSTDIAKMIQVPIFHVNSDDPDAAYQVLQVALDYRQKFQKDVVIDIIGFRRHGHNEGDEPTYTQPVMYQRIREHKGVREIYARKLIAEGVIDEREVTSLMEERMRRYDNAQLGAKEIVARNQSQPALPEPTVEPESVPVMETGVVQPVLRMIAHAMTTVPRGFNLNPKIVGLLARRAKMVEGEVGVDWGMAEELAFGSLLIEGIPVRLTGQDTVRGTFSHRHAAFHDAKTGEEWTPLTTLASNQARFQIYDSPLSETGALGFEYGYSVADPAALVLWEAQFGDFANAAQVIIDQFIASGEEKWNQKVRLVLLLPHGYEGQGPEHSSARIERFLQLCAEENMQVVYCTSSAQYFHVLRRQARQESRKPLVVITPKSLLRLPEAASPADQFTSGGFRPVLGDDSVTAPSDVSRALLCSGKIYYDLLAERERSNDRKTAILRVEQLYPFPKRQIREHLEAFENLNDVRWVQEEPANQGAWYFMEPRLLRILAPGRSLRYVGRPASASTATGSHTIHQMEQTRLVKEAFEE
ncbi:MAG TPA: multifunctional oxoglutarate decarboxylase/oxoglutarate dehydrogenase thiamine pyrophosphate-binding subunit/dihydrolipoyllysine-residue succinyltransferase subunit [Blastocatellia bacterium]|jgi:2-oxoglutarate dehydrogenase E1 component|nr:multifunctional oxoglutarate decarboxylase/oxoglutarate dehydrogenase thiamine pyrophosphate-binding subunit/dihydrolipoyllysine-residue succinyltransferase subunit [Blastocatellia bacterium]